MNANIYSLFESRAPEADRVLMALPGGQSLSYGAAAEQTARYAQALAGLGLRPGDRIACQVEKSAEALVLYLASLRAGLIYLPLNTAYTDAELDYFLADAEPGAIVCRPEREPAVRQLAARRGVGHVLTLDQDGGGSLPALASEAVGDGNTVEREARDVAVILYTSGTTGRPKGAMITHGNLRANGLALTEAWGFTREDRLLHALPIFHIHGLFVAVHCALLSGAAMWWLPRFHVDAVMAELPRSTVFMGVPTFYTRLLAESGFGADHCRGMRLFTCGSAPLLPRTFAEFEARTGHRILERYGMTETGMNTSNPLRGERVPGTVGPALPGVGVRVVDEGGRELPEGETGELLVKGANVFPGYWGLSEKNAEVFTADGYFRTGDLARIDARGYVAIVGRAKDMVITGGYNVYPKEVEQLIDALDGVGESAVFGVPHPDLGEGVTAAVVRPGGLQQPGEQEIIAGLRGRLAGYKVPKRVLFLDELPRNAMGKVQKNLLRERWRELYARG